MIVSAHTHTIVSAHTHAIVSAHAYAIVSVHAHVIVSAHAHTIVSAHAHTIVLAHTHAIVSAHIHTIVSAHAHVIVSAHAHTIASTKRSTTSWHVLMLARSSGTNSMTMTKALPAAVAAVLATVPSCHVHVRSIRSALNTTKLVAALLLVALVCSEKGEEGNAVLVSRCKRHVAVDSVHARGGGLHFIGSCVKTCS